MVFLCWDRPSPDDQKDCITRSGDFNYDGKFRGATSIPSVLLKKDKALAKDGFLINHSRVRVGSGLDSFDKGKDALQNWRHFALNWAFVDNKTPIQNGVKFCVCVKEFFPWLMMPLQVVYSKEDKYSQKALRSFSFAGGTLKGHLLILKKKAVVEASEEIRKTPDIRVGDVVQIKLEVPENNRRLSVYKGIVMSKQNVGIHTPIPIRRIIAGIVVEIVFPVYSPNIKELQVVSHRKVRRARLCYLRDNASFHGCLLSSECHTSCSRVSNCT